jgi:hypothetical protein
MNKFIGKVYGPLVILVNAAILVDVAADLYARWKERRAARLATVSTKEEPDPEEENDEE